MIRVSSVCKTFKIFSTPADRLREKLFGRSFHHEYAALTNVSFEVKSGETLGIIGENGAGKSTLLKLLAGVMLPDSGTVEVSGKVTGLLELGTGFNFDLTGYENISMNGLFLGMSHEEIEEKRDTIIDFAELGNFINEPIKTYSSGMLMRLGFSIAIHAKPECFLIDEALSVGDAYFQQKCMRIIEAFKKQGGSIIIVSHDMNAIKTLCDNAIYLEKGKVISLGNPKDVVDNYLNRILIDLHQGDESIDFIQDKKQGLATSEVELISIKICNERGEEISHIESENIIRIIYEVRASRDLLDPHFSFVLRNKNGLVLYQTNTSNLCIKNSPLLKGVVASIEYEVVIPLTAGIYSFSIGVANKQTIQGSFEEYLLVMNDIKQITVLSKNGGIIVDGIFNMKPKYYCRYY